MGRLVSPNGKHPVYLREARQNRGIIPR